MPPVLAELLSSPDLPDAVSVLLRDLPLMELNSEFRERAGRLRAARRLDNALIAQSCIDRKIPLLTRDGDFRAFVDAAGLDIVARA